MGCREESRDDEGMECFWCGRELEEDEWEEYEVPSEVFPELEPGETVVLAVCAECNGSLEFMVWLAEVGAEADDAQVDFGWLRQLAAASVYAEAAEWADRQRKRLGLRDDVHIPLPPDVTRRLVEGGSLLGTDVDWDRKIVVFNEHNGALEVIERLLWLPLPCPWLMHSKTYVDKLEQLLVDYYGDASEREVDYLIDVFGRAFSGGQVQRVPDLRPFLSDRAARLFEQKNTVCEAVYEWRSNGQHAFIVRDDISAPRVAALLCHCAWIVADPRTFSNIRRGM